MTRRTKAAREVTNEREREREWDHDRLCLVKVARQREREGGAHSNHKYPPKTPGYLRSCPAPAKLLAVVEEKGGPGVDRGRVKVVLAGFRGVQWKRRWSLNEVKRRWIRARWLKISGCSPWRKAAAKIVPTSAVRELRKDEIGRLAAPQQRQGWVPNPPQGQSPA
ncbi:hypothetical protein K438DRAFT_1777592 [Mycena galopus ATCC 62051]|nr:hypothetical protein K438DRAFT_1777592 [Mycena galopus ATCC 62051]